MEIKEKLLIVESGYITMPLVDGQVTHYSLSAHSVSEYHCGGHCSPPAISNVAMLGNNISFNIAIEPTDIVEVVLKYGVV